METMICIVCPKGCHLEAAAGPDETLRVSGAGCPKGTDYAKEELTRPVRMVTSTVAIQGGAYPRLPVKSREPVPKDKVMDAVRALRAVTVCAPVREGEIILEDAAGTGIPFIATRDM